MTSNERIQEILLNAAMLPEERVNFFSTWLHDHFGVQVDLKNNAALAVATIKESLRPLCPDQELLAEVRIVEAEYFWCRQVSIDRIRSLSNGHT